MSEEDVRLRRMVALVTLIAEIDTKAANLPAQMEIIKRKAKTALDLERAGARRSVNLDLARRKAIEAHKARGRDTAIRVQPIIKRLRRAGYKTYGQIAKALDEMGIQPPKAKRWNPRSVMRIEHRKT